jgi:hypothetical protein
LTGSTWLAKLSHGWGANATYHPVPEYKLHRDSPYYFYERTYSPDAVGKISLDEGCGALNLVNVSEPLKVSRLILGGDDLDPGVVRLVPRIPPQWKGVEATNWPIWAGHSIVRAHIQFENRGTGAVLAVSLAAGQKIDDLKVRMPSKNGYVWEEKRHVNSVRIETE